MRVRHLLSWPIPVAVVQQFLCTQQQPSPKSIRTDPRLSVHGRPADVEGALGRQPSFNLWILTQAALYSGLFLGEA